MAVLEVTRPAEKLAVRLAQRARLDGLPLVNAYVDQLTYEEEIRERQKRLQFFAGGVAIVGDFVYRSPAVLGKQKTASQIARGTARILHKYQIISNRRENKNNISPKRPVIVRPLIPARVPSNSNSVRPVLNATRSLQTAISEYPGIDLNYNRDPQRIEPGGLEPRHLIQKTAKATDEVIRGFEDDFSTSYKQDPEYVRPSFVFVVNPHVGADSLPEPIRHEHLALGGVVMLREVVGNSPENNDWRSIV